MTNYFKLTSYYSLIYFQERFRGFVIYSLDLRFRNIHPSEVKQAVKVNWRKKKEDQKLKTGGVKNSGQHVGFTNSN